MEYLGFFYTGLKYTEKQFQLFDRKMSTFGRIFRVTTYVLVKFRKTSE